MARRTVFCVQAYQRRDGRLEGRLRQEFTSATEAEDLGARLALKSAGVVVYALAGDPEAGVWEEPEIFALHGEAPDEIASPGTD